jgi:GxxExxY protein
MHEDLTYAINGCLFTIYNTLGNIWKEEVYEKALAMELKSQGMQAECQKEFDVSYFDRQVGRYRLDLLVNDQVIAELKAAPELVPLHRAQLISYLKGAQKPLGILANFGGTSLEHQTFPNKLHLQTPLRDDFDFEKIQLEHKDEIKDLLVMANRILVTLGVGYLAQIYRRALYIELQQAGAEFEVIKEVTATYQAQRLDSKPVNFFRIGDLLVSVVAVRELTDLILSRFQHHIRYFHLKRGLLINFHALHLDFKYVRL